MFFLRSFFLVVFIGFYSCVLNASETLSVVHAQLALPGDQLIQKGVSSVLSKQLAELNLEVEESPLKNELPAGLVALKENKVDWLTSSLFPALILANKSNVEIIYHEKENVENKYHTVFFVRKNNEINSLSGLERKIINFNHSLSTSGYFIPYYELLEKEYELVLYGNEKSRKKGEKNRIYYKLRKSSKNIVNSVLENIINIGVLSNLEFDALPQSQKKQLKIIFQTVSYPREVEIVRTGLDVQVKEKLKSVLVSQKKATKTRSKLLNSGTRRFDEFIRDGRDGYVYMKNLIKHNVVPYELSNISQK